MPVRNASARWEGKLAEGHGTVRVGTGAEMPYSFSSRFESGSGTNPEELLGAAHAGCFTMALVAALSRGGYTPSRVSTTADVHLEKVADAWQIVRIVLKTEGSVPGVDAAKFQELAEGAKKNCPLSKALAATPIEMTARLV